MYKGRCVIREEYRPPRKQRRHEESPEQDPGHDAACPPLPSIALSLLQSLSTPSSSASPALLTTTANSEAQDTQASTDNTRDSSPVENPYDTGNQSAAAGEAAGGFESAGGGGADSDALARTGDAPLARPTPIRPTAARLPPSTVVLGELGRPTAFSVRPPAPAPSTPARGTGTWPSGATAGGATDSETVGGPGAGRRADNDGARRHVASTSARGAGATDSDAVGGLGAAAAGNSPTGRRAESDGAGAVAGWLAGLGLGRYAEALLGAGWDCTEVGVARGLPQRATARRFVFRKPPVEGVTVLLPSQCGRETPRPGA